MSRTSRNFVDPSGLQLRYFDVRRGLGCVLMGDGIYHCTEYIDRYWYDDGTGDGSGDGSGGEGGGGGGLGGGIDSFDCPNPQIPKAGASITSTQAFKHYLDGSGNPLDMKIREIFADVPRLNSFPSIQRSINKGTTKPFEQISISGATSSPVFTSGDQAAFLGRITFNLSGVLNLYMTGDYQFYGSVGVNQDRYDFDKDNATPASKRTAIGQSSTNLGALLRGKGFNINIDGRFSLDIEGNARGITSYKCR